MAVIAWHLQFDSDGNPLEAGEMHLPEYLDWLPIRVKAHWFRFMGQGSDKAKYVLLKSQGEQVLLSDVTLRQLTHTSYKEKRDGAEAEIDRFIEQGGFSRAPRNQ